MEFEGLTINKQIHLNGWICPWGSVGECREIYATGKVSLCLYIGRGLKKHYRRRHADSFMTGAKNINDSGIEWYIDFHP
jgi:hypothetical protein